MVQVINGTRPTALILNDAVTNAVSGVRSEIVGGKTYLVAPVTMIVPGVLPGSMGPLLYPADEVRKSVKTWNNIPLVVYHPTDAKGKNCSAREPHVPRVGFTRNVTATPMLKGEAWFDRDALSEVDPRVLDALNSGTKIECSTGLTSTVYPAPAWSVCPKGRKYVGVARNYKPDHLAILPDVVGACSIADGCGVLTNAGCGCKGKPKGKGKCRCASPGKLLEEITSMNTLGGKNVIANPLRAIADAGRDLLQESGWHPMDRDLVADEGEWAPVGRAISNDAVSEMSLEDRQSAVRAAFRAAYPSEYDPKTGNLVVSRWIMSVFDDYLIYEETSRGEPYSCELYRLSWTVSRKGVITFGDEPERVRKQTVFVKMD